MSKSPNTVTHQLIWMALLRPWVNRKGRAESLDKQTLGSVSELPNPNRFVDPMHATVQVFITPVAAKNFSQGGVS
tara:strand:- start:20314 stop:20538 length:225 start_codon:yes stop_codon:yes gene_type:complete